MQIAGNKCKICGLKIVLSSEGEYCSRCHTFAHSACEPGEMCSACGNRLDQYEPPEAAPARDAILPRSLRPAGSGAAALAIGFMLLFALAILLFFSCMRDG